MTIFLKNQPVLKARQKIVDAFRQNANLILLSPPGSGKSTCVPLFFLDEPFNFCKILVLQPRRMAATHLSTFVAGTLDEEPGETVGYQVRFESKISSRSRVIYQTYGVFLRQLLENPTLADVDLVIFDEFHERTLEMDLALAWLKHLRNTQSGNPGLIVMSATLDCTSLQSYLAETTLLEISATRFPVEISHQEKEKLGVPIEEQAAKAYQMCLNLEGSALIFMPGIREINRTISILEEFCRKKGISLRALHGSMPLREQMEVIESAEKTQCCIVSTNLAETSITVPGVKLVIDSGLVRRSAYDPDKDRNTLYLNQISMFNAHQRSGRAGRTGPGRCIRLWSSDTEKMMKETIEPEVLRLELSNLVLTVLGLLSKCPSQKYETMFLPWLCAPESSRWESALSQLLASGAVKRDANGAFSITSLGEKILSLPIHPLTAAVLLKAQERGNLFLSCAAAAVWESSERSGMANVFETALEMVDTTIPGETGSLFRQLRSHFDAARLSREEALCSQNSLEKLLADFFPSWAEVLHHRIAVYDDKEGKYLLSGGKYASLPTGTEDKPACIVALTIRNSAGSSQSRKQAIMQYIPCDVQWVEAFFRSECRREAVFAFSEKEQQVIAQEQVLWRGMVLRKSSRPGHEVDPHRAAELLAEKVIEESDNWEPRTMQLIYRVRLAKGAVPEYGFPALDREDYLLMFTDAFTGVSSIKNADDAFVQRVIRNYIGAALHAELDRLLPEKLKLPSGRTAKVNYSEDARPEVSARIGDFVGVTSVSLCDGKIAVCYDILAPNFRTVQKTVDIAGFWKNTYPELKTQLQRRYPRHPWP